jgi:hypothetical protein
MRIRGDFYGEQKGDGEAVISAEEQQRQSVEAILQLRQDEIKDVKL